MTCLALQRRWLLLKSFSISRGSMRTLHGLLIAEINTKKLATEGQPTGPIIASNATIAAEFYYENSAERSLDLCKKNIATDNSKLVVPTDETVKAAKVKDYSITEQKVK